jgi:serine/threonine-protein kinase HipA
MNRKADVFFRDRKAGMLVELEGGQYRFSYDPDYLAVGPAISLTLPLQPEPFESSSLFPFFAGLIPEGWYLRIVATTLHVDENDAFGLLMRACGDCIGAVSVRGVADAAG